MRGLSIIFTIIIAAVVILVLGLILISTPESSLQSFKKTVMREEERSRFCVRSCNAMNQCGKDSDGNLQVQVSALGMDSVCGLCLDIATCRDVSKTCENFAQNYEELRHFSSTTPENLCT